MMRIVFSCVLLVFLYGCSRYPRYSVLQSKLSEFCDDKDADIGVAVIIDGKDTIAVNGNDPFPMLSVYKFPIALALRDVYIANDLSTDAEIAIFPEDLHLDTYSPMTETILKSSQIYPDTLKLTTAQILAYMLQQSDNNASDIALRNAGGALVVSMCMRRIGLDDIKVNHSEAQMHRDNSRCYANTATPLAMAKLLDVFDKNYIDSFSMKIKHLMETSATGINRLSKPINNMDGVVIGHKTGTGFTLSNGRLMAINDVGYVHLSDGRRYTIAVFVKDSGYDLAQTEALIADISKIVFESIE